MPFSSPRHKKKIIRKVLWPILTLFICLNIIAAIHAYKFTHFSATGTRTERLNLSFASKLRLLFTGVDNPRPVNTWQPKHRYRQLIINSNVKISCWYEMTNKPCKGTVLLFHGYTSNKSALLDRAAPFLDNGYNCLLADFMGSGGSEGNQTTIGFREAEEVKDCFNYIRATDTGNIYLFGSSMGAVAIMKAMKDYQLPAKAIIIECPFGTMYQTVCARFRMLHIPSFPMAGILLFWGSVENNFWGFTHNPVEYARYIHCPTLLQYGAKDDRVTRKEIDDIYSNIPGQKQLIIYPSAGHDNYLTVAEKEWTNNTITFLSAN